MLTWMSSRLTAEAPAALAVPRRRLEEFRGPAHFSWTNTPPPRMHSYRDTCSQVKIRE
jgi:hypothetical protein